MDEVEATRGDICHKETMILPPSHFDRDSMISIPLQQASDSKLKPRPSNQSQNGWWSEGQLHQ